METKETPINGDFHLFFLQSLTQCSGISHLSIYNMNRKTFLLLHQQYLILIVLQMSLHLMGRKGKDILYYIYK